MQNSVFTLYGIKYQLNVNLVTHLEYVYWSKQYPGDIQCHIPLPKYHCLLTTQVWIELTTKDFIEYLNFPNNTYTLIDKPLELYTNYDTSIIKIVSDYCDKIKQ